MFMFAIEMYGCVVWIKNYTLETFRYRNIGAPAYSIAAMIQQCLLCYIGSF